MKSYESQVRAAVGRLVAEALAHRPALPQVFALLEQAENVAAHATARVQALAPPPQPIECDRGCAWCCFLKVAVTPAEALRIADWLRVHLSPTNLTALQDALAASESRTHGLSWQRHVALQIPCPFLNPESACGIYSVRPLSCRGHNSTSAAQCRDYYDRRGTLTLPVYAPQADIAGGVLGGLSDGLAAAGLQGEVRELISAVRIALESPNAGDRWLAGEQVF